MAYTKAEKKWIESHGGKVGVVTEREARGREAAYARDKRAEAASKQRKQERAALGEVPTAADIAAVKRRKQEKLAALGEVPTAADIAAVKRRKQEKLAALGEVPTAADRAAVKRRREPVFPQRGAGGEILSPSMFRDKKGEPIPLELTERAKQILASGMSINEKEERIERLMTEGPSLKDLDKLPRSRKERLEIAKKNVPFVLAVAKSPVPWLDFGKKWKSLKGDAVNKGAYLAGEIGATVLYLAMVGGVVRAAYLARPASSTLGTFGRAGKVKVPGPVSYTHLTLPTILLV